MSWQSYIDNDLVGTGKIASAAIHGLDGSQWATSVGFNVSSFAQESLLSQRPAKEITKISGEEVEKIVKGYADPDTVRSDGFHLQGEKYITIKADGKTLYAKRGQKGVYAVKTGMALVVGTFDTPIQPGDAAKAVDNFADYLISKGYVSKRVFSGCTRSSFPQLLLTNYHATKVRLTAAAQLLSLPHPPSRKVFHLPSLSCPHPVYHYTHIPLSLST